MSGNGEADNPELMDHPCFRQPSNPSGLIWRYLDLPRFISLLSTQSLYLANLTTLPDKHEGTLPKKLAEQMESAERAAVELGDEVIREYEGHFTHLRRCMFVSCWFMSDCESDALWRIYGGVAVAVRYDKLRRSLTSADLIGQVNYLDYENDMFPGDNMYRIAMNKRNMFSHENEVRIVRFAATCGDEVQYTGSNSVKLHDPTLRMYPNGILYPFKVNDLVESIWVSPYADSVFYAAVQELCSKYGVSSPVNWSSIRANPYLHKSVWTRKMKERKDFLNTLVAETGRADGGAVASQ